MSLLSSMPHTVRHERRQYSEAADGYGKIDAFDILQVDLGAWVQNASANDVMEADKHRATAMYKIFMATPPTSPLRAGDYLYVTAGPSYVGRRFKFYADADRSAGLGVLRGGVFELDPIDDPPERDS